MKAALSAAVSQSQTYYIPTPDAHPAPVDHEELYPRAFKQGKQFIKWPGKTLEDLFADMARYDADPEDAAFAKNEAVDLDIFEWIIDCFEECAHKLVLLHADLPNWLCCMTFAE